MVCTLERSDFRFDWSNFAVVPTLDTTGFVQNPCEIPVCILCLALFFQTAIKGLCMLTCRHPHRPFCLCLQRSTYSYSTFQSHTALQFATSLPPRPNQGESALKGFYLLLVPLAVLSVAWGDSPRDCCALVVALRQQMPRTTKSRIPQKWIVK